MSSEVEKMVYGGMDSEKSQRLSARFVRAI
jgi:hypothetical protein